MPVYEYRCQSCGAQFERLFLSLRQVPAEIACPACQGLEVRRLLSAPAWRREGGSVGPATEVDSAPAKPEVFGRKELEAAMKNKPKS